MTAPGWYKDPVDPDVQRYWDGEGWLGEPVPASEPTPSGPPAKKAEPAAPPAPAAAPTAPTAPTWPTGPTGPTGPAAPITPGAPLPQGAVVLPPGTPVPPGGFRPGQLPPGAIVLPPGTPLPPGLMPQGNMPTGAVQVLLPPQSRAPGQFGPQDIRPHGHDLAPLGARLLARLIDIAVVGLLSGAATGWLIYRYVRDVGPVIAENARRSMNNESALATPDRATPMLVIILLLIAAMWFAYEVPATANTGQTFGKRLMKIKVMGLDTGQPVGFARAIRRWNPLGLSVLLWTCFVGFLLQLLDSLSPLVDWPLRRAFHDRSAGTIVVKAQTADTPTATSNAGEQR